MFIGLGENYGEDIWRSPIFPLLLEYPQNGPQLRRRYRRIKEKVFFPSAEQMGALTYSVEAQ
jgi:hypothetical protein